MTFCAKPTLIGGIPYCQDGQNLLLFSLEVAYFGSCEVLQTDGRKEFGSEFSHGIL